MDTPPACAPQVTAACQPMPCKLQGIHSAAGTLFTDPYTKPLLLTGCHLPFSSYFPDRGARGLYSHRSRLGVWGRVLFNVCLSRQGSMINLPRGCADSHGYCISLNVSPPTGPQIQNSFGKQHGNESTKMGRFEFANAVCFLFDGQQSLLGCESLSTHFLKEVYFGPL